MKQSKTVKKYHETYPVFYFGYKHKYNDVFVFYDDEIKSFFCCDCILNEYIYQGKKIFLTKKFDEKVDLLKHFKEHVRKGHRINKQTFFQIVNF